MSREELHTLIRQFGTHLAWRREHGAYGVPAGQTRRTADPGAWPSASPVPTAPPASTAAPLADATPAHRAEPPSRLSLPRVRAELGECTRCKLSATRKTIVFGVGNPAADLVFVGEGPGYDEDQQGEPFVGKAGQLLDKMIAAMGLTREQVYICNVVKCRPPGNRNPEPDEVAACEPFLRQQLDAIAPRFIVALGKFAAQTLLRTTAPISALRGRWHSYQGIQLMPTFHPAFLLRSPERKRDAWHDLQLVMAEMKRLGA
jgi:DNA polymerase